MYKVRNFIEKNSLHLVAALRSFASGSVAKPIPPCGIPLSLFPFFPFIQPFASGQVSMAAAPAPGPKP